jgi:hypothetical protein
MKEPVMYVIHDFNLMYIKVPLILHLLYRTSDAEVWSPNSNRAKNVP